MHDLIVGQCGEALLDGQRYAERLGMNIHDPARIALRVAQSQGYTACSRCFPGQATPRR